ncbi:DnaB-like helicase C-terminal domain-containing protein, partial [uncultured Nostoc sp.]|uniref:DnaB-like helicase C-terminal domain-containing protein n=1 Tax=uncultured Nostoc sp. TaxID=340711 RepID=UPI0035C99C6F
MLKQLRAIAKQFNCAVLGLAQLKREVDSRSEKRPTKADFRESGGFEQEAAVMLGLYREDYIDISIIERVRELSTEQLEALGEAFLDFSSVICNTQKILKERGQSLAR